MEPYYVVKINYKYIRPTGTLPEEGSLTIHTNNLDEAKIIRRMINQEGILGLKTFTKSDVYEVGTIDIFTGDITTKIADLSITK